MIVQYCNINKKMTKLTVPVLIQVFKRFTGGGTPKMPPKLPSNKPSDSPKSAGSSYTQGDLANVPKITEPMLDPYVTYPVSWKPSEHVDVTKEVDTKSPSMSTKITSPLTTPMKSIKDSVPQSLKQTSQKASTHNEEHKSGDSTVTDVQSSQTMPQKSGLIIGFDAAVSVNSLPTPNKSHPPEPLTPTAPAIPATSQQSTTSQDHHDSGITDNLLASTAGLKPVSVSSANDPHGLKDCNDSKPVSTLTDKATPPPPPPTPLPPIIKSPVSTGTNHVSQIQALAKLNGNPDCLSPSQIPSSMKALKSHNGKTFETMITPKTAATDFTKEALLHELKIRELIKDDDGKTAVTILQKNNEPVVIGESKNKVKLSQMGQAYYEKFVKSKEIIHEQINPMPPIEKLNNAKLGISIPPTSTSETIVDIGIHKHLLLADDPENKDYVIAYGYLTSKNSGYVLNKKQFKVFQNQCENEALSPKAPKTQQLVLFEFPRRIKVEKIKSVKYDNEYLKTVSDGAWAVIYIKLKEKWEAGIQNIPNDGITKEDALQMCQEYDKIAAQEKGKEKHPITMDQAQINEANKKIQQEKNKAQKQENNAKKKKPSDSF